MVALVLLGLGGRGRRRRNGGFGRRHYLGDGRRGLRRRRRGWRRPLVGRRIRTRHRRVGRGAQRRMILDAGALALVAERLVVIHLVWIVVALALAADVLAAQHPPERAVLLGHHRGEVIARGLAAVGQRHAVGAIARRRYGSRRTAASHQGQAEHHRKNEDCEPREAHIIL